jgi:TetR/AcrR family transcriptional regulator, transcriptional repressor for nem operon
MPRPANLAREDILERAMHLFWEKGYRAVSMDELVRDVGTTRTSVYREFGGKRRLFETSLDRYADGVVTAVLRPMTDGTDGIAAIEKYFEDIIRKAERGGRLSRGCLMTNTMTELGATDRRIRRRTEAHFARVARAFESALGRARARRELRDDVRDLKAWALHLATFAQGTWVCARSGVGARELRRAIRASLLAIRA